MEVQKARPPTNQGNPPHPPKQHMSRRAPLPLPMRSVRPAPNTATSNRQKNYAPKLGGVHGQGLNFIRTDPLLICIFSCMDASVGHKRARNPNCKYQFDRWGHFRAHSEHPVFQSVLYCFGACPLEHPSSTLCLCGSGLLLEVHSDRILGKALQI